MTQVQEATAAASSAANGGDVSSTRSSSRPRTGGVAPIKAEYLRKNVVAQPIDDDAAEHATNPAATHAAAAVHGESAGETGRTDADEAKLSGAQRKKRKKQEAAEQRKKARGMNTKRRFEHVRDANMVCNNIARGLVCPRETCKFSHSIAAYLQTKPKDIRFPHPPMTSKQGCLMELAENERVAYLDKLYSTTAPFTHFGNDDLGGIIDPHTLCPVAAARQHASSSGGTAGASHATCYAGWTCRFLGAHAQQPGDGKGVDGTGWELTGSNQTHVDGQSDDAIRRNAPDERNWLPQWVPRALKTREYPLHLTKAALKRLADEVESTELERRGPIYIDEDAARRVYGTRPTTSSNGAHSGGQKGPADQQYDGDDDDDDLDQLMNGGPLARKPAAVEEERRAMRVYDAAHSICDVDVARIRPSEKRRLDWFHDELYLAPLTTTGNLPFRRLCTSYGADITCGEMGLAESYLTGSKNEWSLVRRWEGERCFGTQLCGSKPDLLVPTAEALAREFQGGLDFIDVNCGCPIDMVFSRGGGSALLDHGAKLGRIVRGMSAVTGDVPITVKLRTGTGSAQTTHKLFPKIKVDWDAGAATMHGRSRQQRYKHLADWDFIRRCATALRDSITQNNEERPDEEWVHPIPVYGNGDVYSWQDYEANKALTGVDGEMVARGALIKPWLFTEIKERRDWDISSRERLDIVRQLSSYGLTHWGSDSLGVNQTRRFVCEALSFMHRYIPIGLLERLPVSMNDRPPAFAGRDDLETLLASSNARDWVRVSEMFLGKAPEPWSFTPKHKSNSYDDGTAENQG